MTPHHQARLQMLTDDGKTELQALAKMLTQAEGTVENAWTASRASTEDGSTSRLAEANAELLLILTALVKKLGNTTGLMRTP